MKKYVLKLTGENLNQYVIGKISGIIDALTDFPDEPHPNRQYPNGHCEIHFRATKDQCIDILKALDRRYGGIVEYKVIG